MKKRNRLRLAAAALLLALLLTGCAGSGDNTTGAANDGVIAQDSVEEGYDAGLTGGEETATSDRKQIGRAHV